MIKFRKLGLAVFLTFILGIVKSQAAEDLIPPSRSLEGREEVLARLTVVSEPPELEVFLDDSRIGNTPIWHKEVKPGPHKLQVHDAEKDIYVESGKALRLSYFKGSFIELPEEKEEIAPAEPEPEKLPEPTTVKRPREEDKPRDLTPWERFINRTSPIF